MRQQRSDKDKFIRKSRAMTFMMPVMMLIVNGISVFITWSGAHGLTKADRGAGDMMASIQYTMVIIRDFLMFKALSIMLPRAAVVAAVRKYLQV